MITSYEFKKSLETKVPSIIKNCRENITPAYIRYFKD